MSLSGVAQRLTPEEVAREPRMLHVVAWFAGNAVGSGGRSTQTFPRRLTPDEAESWREGWREGRRERVCHSWHGFTPCPGGHPVTLNVTRDVTPNVPGQKRDSHT